MLGFVIRQTLEIKNSICVKVLYSVLVRSILESRTASIESIQTRFSSISLYRLQWPSSQQLDYLSRCMLLGLQTLEHTRQALQVTFVVKLFTVDIDSNNK